MTEKRKSKVIPVKITKRICTTGVTAESYSRFSSDLQGPLLYSWDGKGNNRNGNQSSSGSSTIGGELFGITSSEYFSQDGVGGAFNDYFEKRSNTAEKILFGKQPPFPDLPDEEDIPQIYGLGYNPDRPDHRDFGLTELISSLHKKKQKVKRTEYLLSPIKTLKNLPRKLDLRDEGEFGPANMQGAVQSCTAQAVTSMAEYHLRRSGNDNYQVQLSRLFLYKVARELLGIEDDRGCTLRETMKAFERYGCLNEDEWPYRFPWLNRLPRIREIENALQLRKFRYCRLDHSTSDLASVLASVLATLAAGFPVAFGYSIFSCIDKMGNDNEIPLPCPGNSTTIIGSHAVLAVGYRFRLSEVDGPQGEILIRNSWGRKWGDNGYAWLPFDYVTLGIARDFWTLYPI